MPEEDAAIQMLSVEEANELLPEVRAVLKELRLERSEILRAQAQIEIEEMTGGDSKGGLTSTARTAVGRWMAVLQERSGRFKAALGQLQNKGAHLKDLDQGLVDFYSRRGQEIVFLCWKEGEAEVGHWHSLEGGFQSRKPLD